MKDIKGYKAFNKNQTNRYGVPFIEGNTYKVDGEISFGNNGNGFHMCTHLSDVFRYFDAIDDNISVAKVIGRGDRKEYNDEYEGYYDMYACRELYIERFLSREEIISCMLVSVESDVVKFLKTFRLTGDEKVRFLRKFKGNQRVLEYILYYQYGIEDAFCKCVSDEEVKRIRLVNKYGQDSDKRCSRK